MTDAERQYFEAMESMFATQGWKLLMDDVAGFKSAIADQWRSINPEGLRLLQGRYDGLDQIAKYEETLANLKAQAATNYLDAA